MAAAPAHGLADGVYRRDALRQLLDALPLGGRQRGEAGDWPRFWAEHGGERVFTGVVDECQVEQSGNGSVLELSGRGMAALLLDNEALGQDYGTATLEDILRDHVRPYGIQAAAGAKLPR